MGLTKLSDLPEEAIAKIVGGDERESASLLSEKKLLREWFKSEDIEPTRMRRKLRHKVGRGKGSGEKLHRSPESVVLFQMAIELARKEGDERARAVHLARVIRRMIRPTTAATQDKSRAAGPELAAASAKRPSGEKVQGGILRRFGRDLTAEAAKGTLDVVVGRRAELRRLAQVLSQKRKGNALLLGDAGVGKTCIVEGLAQQLNSPRCPPAFREKQIVELSMASLVAGTCHRGDLEKRLQAMIREAEGDPNLILFIDEFHTIMGKKGEALDAANILKPALGRGQLRLIGATTTKEYERHLAGDEAIARRFEVVWVEEPSRTEALEIIAGVKEELEKHHGLLISQEAIDASVDLSIRYLPDRRLPDKALDLLDQACSQRALQSLSIKSGGDQGGTVTFEGESATVGRADVARALSARCRVPLELLAASDQERLKVLEPYLAKRILGQQKAMKTIAGVLHAAYLGLKDPGRPVASFLFAGPTGVGKTETAKALSEFLFGGEDRLIRIDLSEYMEKHQVARLIGAPPGYTGSEDPGMLTSALRQRPASVVLFDEIDKAHPDVLNLLLQLLDEGQLTDGQGRKASFRESVVILTSNIMPVDDEKPHMGFGAREAETPRFSIDRLVQALRSHLRPELIGRIDHLIRFEALPNDALGAIAERAYAGLSDRLARQGVELPESLLAKVLLDLSSGQFGARGIARLVESKVAAWLRERDALAEHSDVLGEVVLSTLAPTSQTEAALLVLDLVQSTNLVLDHGDTFFSDVIGRLDREFRDHDSASELLFLKCTGDGFLAVYRSIPPAFSAGRAFLANAALQGTAMRVALHWGAVKTGPGGDPLGSEVHRVFRMEGVREEDRVAAPGQGAPLPESGRILATCEVLERLDARDREAFHPAGKFRLKGFDEPCELWIATWHGSMFSPVVRTATGSRDESGGLGSNQNRDR